MRYVFLVAAMLVTMATLSFSDGPPLVEKAPLLPDAPGGLAPLQELGDVPKEMPTSDAEKDVKPEPMDYVSASRKVWEDYRAACKGAHENLHSALDTAAKNLQANLQSLRADARVAVLDSRVVDAREVAKMKHREVRVLSVKYYSEAINAVCEAWKNHHTSIKSARETRNFALEALRNDQKTIK